MAVCREHAVQFGERRHCHQRWPQRHGRAKGFIQHPASNRQHDAGAHLDVDDLARSAALAVLPAQPSAVQGVPTVEDLNFLPDMGRMNTNWPSAGRTGCSQDRCAPVSERRR